MIGQRPSVGSSRSSQCQLKTGMQGNGPAGIEHVADRQQALARTQHAPEFDPGPTRDAAAGVAQAAIHNNEIMVRRRQPMRP